MVLVAVLVDLTNYFSADTSRGVPVLFPRTTKTSTLPGPPRPLPGHLDMGQSEMNFFMFKLHFLVVYDDVVLVSLYD